MAFQSGDKVTLTNTLFPTGEAGVVQGVNDLGVYRVSVPSLGLVAASEDELAPIDASSLAPVDAPVDPASFSPDIGTITPPEMIS